MGNVRVREGMLEHDIGRGREERWVRIGYDDEGAPIRAILSADVVTFDEPDGGSVIVNAGGMLIAFPPNVAAQLAETLAQHAPVAGQVRAREQIEQFERQVDELRAARDEQLQAIQREHADAVARLNAEIVDLEGRRQALEEDIKQMEAGRAADSGADPSVRP